MRGRFATVGAAVLALSLTACSSAGDPAPSSSPAGASTTPQPVISASAAPSTPAEQAGSLIAQAPDSSLTVYVEPDGDEQQTVEAADVLTVPEQTPLVFLVKDREPGWVELYLPVRPNGTTGWVPESAVSLSSTTFEVVVSLADYELTVTDGDHPSSVRIRVGSIA